MQQQQHCAGAPLAPPELCDCLGTPRAHLCTLPLPAKAGAFLPGLSSPPPLLSPTATTTSRPFPCPQGNPPSPRESWGPRTSWLQSF